MLDTLRWAKQVASNLSLKFHFLREQHNLLRFKGTSSHLPQVAWCFLSGLLQTEGRGGFQTGAQRSDCS